MLKITQTNSIILNFIRFLCSQGVVLGHLMHFFNFKNSFFNGIASYCVLLFFILSGFLISYSLSSNLNKNSNYNFRVFFVDRFFRIYPPFVAALILVLFLDIIV
ncbi:MAG: acyltransferase family protein, partial [Bacteroidia bacterium]|nr:acyltransferase family protein [Bacteroidia bacterium]